jgi:superfamily II DNA or RNA helicase
MLEPAPRTALAHTALTAFELDLLTVLALVEPLPLAPFTELVRAAVSARPASLEGAGGEPINTRTLKRHLDALTARDLLQMRSGLYRSSEGSRFRVLRSSERAGALAPVKQAVRERLLPTPAFGRARDPVPALRFDARALLAIGDPRALTVINALAAAEGREAVVSELLAPALTPFDEPWFAGLSNDLRARVLTLLLPVAEQSALHLPALYGYLAERPQLIPTGAHAAWLSLRLYAGDTSALERFASFTDARAQALSAAAMAALEGRFERCLEALGRARDGTKLPGFAGALEVLLLFRLGGPADEALAKKLLSARDRREARFRSSFDALRVWARAEHATEPPTRSGPARAGDWFAPLARLLTALFRPRGEAELRRAALAAEAQLERLDPQLRYARAEYAAALLRASQHGADLNSELAASLSLREPQRSPGLAALEPRTAPWEARLNALERLGHDDAVREERLIWRTSLPLFALEPALQKREKDGFTRGKRLPLKRLVQPGSLELDERDALVAAHVEEHRGAPSSVPRYSLPHRAWRALIGHPRVFVADRAAPTEVVQGTFALYVQQDADEVELTLEPADVGPELTVRLESGRLVVYDPDEALEDVIRVVGSGLRMPRAAETRLRELLERLGRVLTIHTSEEVRAREVPADERLWFRCVPHGLGVAVSLSVRPLGESGPQVLPGRGAPLLLARVGDETLRTRRDLAAERVRVVEVWRATSALADVSPHEPSFRLAGPLTLLEFLAGLRELGERVALEWPLGMPLRVRGSVGRQALHGAVKREGPSLFVHGEVQVDEGLAIPLGTLVALAAEAKSRFVALESGEYLELESDLYDLLHKLAAHAIRSRKRADALRLSASALDTFEGLCQPESGFALDSDAAAWRAQLDRVFTTAIQVPTDLHAALRAYQEDGFRWLARLADLGLGACLADDMGLGKTVQLIALLLHRRERGPAIVVVPTSVCTHWSRELARFAPSLECRIYAGPRRTHQLAGLAAGTVLLTTYAVLQQDRELLARETWATAILDEAQLIKNAHTSRASAAFGLRAEARIAASGTPIENHLGDLYSLFRFLLPDLLGSWRAFRQRYGAATAADGRVRDSLRRVLRPFILRRTKHEVLTDLPPLTEIQHMIALSPAERALYTGVQQEALAKLSQAKRDGPQQVQLFAELMRLRRLACHPALAFPSSRVQSSKITALLELVEELHDGQHRALVFSQFVDLLTIVRGELEERGVRYQYLDGSSSTREREAAVDAFQRGEGSVFLISLRAGGFGLNLTGADYVVHLDPWWNPAVEAQGTDRARRIGQTRPVTVYRLIAAATVEERILELHRAKREVADALLEGGDQAARLSAEELRSLLEG